MRGNPRLVARHALSSSTQAQILTAATFTSGVQLKIDSVEEGERKIPATVQAALRNVISHHPSTAPRSKTAALMRTQGCQTVSVEKVALSTTAVQTEDVYQELTKEDESVEEVMDTQCEEINKISEVPKENVSPPSPHLSSPVVSNQQPMVPTEQCPSPSPTVSSTQSQFNPSASPLPSVPQIPLSPHFDIPSPIPPTTTNNDNELQCSSSLECTATDTATSSTSLLVSHTSPIPSTPMSSLVSEPPAQLDAQLASPSNQPLAQSSTESFPMEECTELLSGMQGEKDDKDTLMDESPFSVASVSSPSLASTKELSPRKSHSLSVSNHPSIPSLSPPPMSAPPFSSELTPEMEESEMMAAVASQLGLDALDSSLLNMADLISLLEPSAATASSLVQPPLPIEEPSLPPSIPPPPALSLLPLQDSDPPSLTPHLSSPATSASFSPSLPSLVTHHALPSPQQLQEAISFSPCDEPLAFDEQSLLRELPADLQETVQAILDGSTDTIQ